MPWHAALGRERRARGDGAAQALQAGEQRGLLAHHVRAGALDDRRRRTRSRCRGCRRRAARRARALDRRLERGLGARVLGAHEDEAVVGADRVAGERHALEQQLGVVAPSAACRCRSRGRPRRRWRRSPSSPAPRARTPTWCRRGTRRRRGRGRSAALTVLEQLLGRELGQRARAGRRPVAGRQSAPARRARSRSRARAPGRSVRRRARARPRPGPRRPASPSRTAAAVWQKPRQTVSASETRAVVRALAQRRGRAPRPTAVDVASPKSAAQQAVPVQTRHVARPARLQRGRRRRSRRRRPRPRAGPDSAAAPAAVLVGDLAALVHRLLEHVERGRARLALVRAQDVGEVARHQKRPMVLPSSSMSTFSAAGVLPRPGICWMSPQSGTSQPAPV